MYHTYTRRVNLSFCTGRHHQGLRRPEERLVALVDRDSVLFPVVVRVQSCRFGHTVHGVGTEPTWIQAGQLVDRVFVAYQVE